MEKRDRFPVFLKFPLVKHTRFELDGIFLPQSTMVDIMLVSYYPWVAAARSISSLPFTNRYLLYIIID